MVDIIAPGQVTTLAAPSGSILDTSFILTWTSVGDDGLSGTATLYDIRYNTETITALNWDTSVIVQNGLIPQIAGSSEQFTVNTLLPNSVYYFAIKVKDEVGNQSIISNVVTATTLPRIYGEFPIVSFLGDSELSIVWLKPNTADFSVVYQYKQWAPVDGPEPSSWNYLGSNTTLKAIDVGERLKGYYVYKFSGLVNGKLYNTRVRAVDQASATTSTDSGVVITNTPQGFSNESPTTDRLMRGLDKKYSNDSNSILYKIFKILAIHLHDFYIDFKNLAIPQLNILTSTGEFVDNWGFLYHVARKQNETDEEYAQRIVRSAQLEKATKGSLARALEPYAENGVVIVEGAFNYSMFYVDVGYFDYDPYVLPSIAGTPHQITFNLNNLLNTTEISFGSELGGQGTDHFSFIIRLKTKASGNPASREVTRNVINAIVKAHKVAGTIYHLYDDGQLITFD